VVIGLAEAQEHHARLELELLQLSLHVGRGVVFGIDVERHQTELFCEEVPFCVRILTVGRRVPLMEAPGAGVNLEKRTIGVALPVLEEMRETKVVVAVMRLGTKRTF